MFISPAHPVLTLQQQCDTTLLFYEVQGTSIKITVWVYQIRFKDMRFFFFQMLHSNQTKSTDLLEGTITRKIEDFIQVKQKDFNQHNNAKTTALFLTGLNFRDEDDA